MIIFVFKSITCVLSMVHIRENEFFSRLRETLNSTKSLFFFLPQKKDNVYLVDKFYIQVRKEETNLIVKLYFSKSSLVPYSLKYNLSSCITKFWYFSWEHKLRLSKCCTKITCVHLKKSQFLKVHQRVGKFITLLFPMMRCFPF